MNWLFSFGLLSHDYLCIHAMKISWIVLLIASLMAACSGEGLSPERKACLENAKQRQSGLDAMTLQQLGRIEKLNPSD